MTRALPRIPVALNGKFLNSQPTGVHRVAHELIGALDQLIADGHEAASRLDCRLVCPRDATDFPELGHISRQSGGVLTWQFWEQFELPFLCRDRLLVNLCNLGPVARAGVTMVHDAQVFISPQSYSVPFRTWYRWALPRLGWKARRLLTVSEYSRHQLAQYGVADYENISVIHNGVDHMGRVQADASTFEALGLEPNRYVVALANTQKHKNIRVLLQAFARPELADARLVLIGSGSAQSFAAAGLICPPNVLFSGRVADGQMRGLMERAACLAFPSTTEGFGLPPLEAMFVGCPAVLAPCGALPEVCGDRATYAWPDDAEAWAKTLASFIASPERREQEGRRGREHAQTFTWRRSAETLVGVLAELTPSREQPVASQRTPARAGTRR